jgi:hypothetical protein
MVDGIRVTLHVGVVDGIPGTIWLGMALDEVGISGNGDLGNYNSGSSSNGVGSNVVVELELVP